MQPQKTKLPLIIGGVFLLYFISTGISYAMFHYLTTPENTPSQTSSDTSNNPGKKSGFKVDTSLPKTEACPLNGGLFTKEEQKIWDARRPLSVMIENHQDARPQSGLSSADIVYEAAVEGGITRFMGVYYCGAAAQDVMVGPIRSSRVYYLDFVSEYSDYPLYVHAGGANDFGNNGDTTVRARALEKITSFGWETYNDIPDMGLPTFWRDTERIGHTVAWEHTLYSTTDKLWELAHKRGLDAQNDKGIMWDKNFVSWKFKDDAAIEKRGNKSDIQFAFFGNYPEYAVNWKYNEDTNFYSRFDGGDSHNDRNNSEQLKAKTVIVQLTKEEGPVDRNKHMLYGTIGKGKVLVFQDGQAIEGNWKKDDTKTRTLFTDSKGKEIEFNRGPIWIEIVATNNPVSY